MILPTLPAPLGPPAVSLPGPGPDGSETALREAATALEASFLAEMLRGAGLGAPAGAFGGGAGEDQFSSFLADAHARAIAEKGGIGLAEALFRALSSARDDGAGGAG